MGIIYKATSPSGKCYVGKTAQGLEKRMRRHKTSFKKTKSKFYDAIKKYGFENFEWEIIEDDVQKDALDKKERHYIELLDSLEGGYNMTSGGDGGDTFSGRKHSLETKGKMSKNNVWNSEYADALREKMRFLNIGEKNPMFGKKNSKKCRERASERMQGKKNPFYGEKHSLETRQRISKANKGRLVGEKNHKAKLTVESVRQIKFLLGAGKTRKDIANDFGISYSTVERIHKGLSWGHVY